MTLVVDGGAFFRSDGSLLHLLDRAGLNLTAHRFTRLTKVPPPVFRDLLLSV